VISAEHCPFSFFSFPSGLLVWVVAAYMNPHRLTGASRTACRSASWRLLAFFFLSSSPPERSRGVHYRGAMAWWFRSSPRFIAFFLSLPLSFFSPLLTQEARKVRELSGNALLDSGSRLQGWPWAILNRGFLCVLSPFLLLSFPSHIGNSAGSSCSDRSLEWDRHLFRAACSSVFFFFGSTIIFTQETVRFVLLPLWILLPFLLF